LWVADRTDRAFALFGPGREIPATWFQSINPLLIILGTPLLIRAWKRRNAKETISHLLRRMAVGCLIASAAMLVMVLAAIESGADGARVSSLWVLTYFVLLTIGELFVLPVGLTLIATLSPVRFAATAMGGWYIAKFLGSLLAGVMGAYWLVIPPAAFFGLGLGTTLLAALCLFAMSRTVKHA
jgi:POT family proton-dependent oligopeptide transporter